MKKTKDNNLAASAAKLRSFRVGGYSVAATAIVIAIAVVVNLLVGALPAGITQFDTTANQLFALSDQTKEIAGTLDTQVQVYWIVQSGSEDSYIQTLLERYQALSGNIRVTKKDPDVYPTFAQQYTSESVSNNSLIVVCGERYRYVKSSEIYVYDYTDYFVSGSYDVTFEGESALTSAIAYVTNEDLPKLYTLTGHGEGTLADTFREAVEKENMELAELSLLTVESVPEDADCVLIYAPQNDISTEELEQLRSYLASGGSLFLVADPPEEGKERSNLETLMADYGVTAQPGIVVEGSSSAYAWSTPYCLLPQIQSHTATDPLLQGGYHVVLPIAQGLKVSQELPEGMSVTELLTTTDTAYAKLAGYGMTTYEKEEGDADGPFALATASSDSVSGANVVWVGSTELLDEQTNTKVSGANQDLFLNLLGWMCDYEESISIRAKSLEYSYLSIDSSTVTVMTVLIIGVIPLGFLAVGVVTWFRRRRR